MKTRMLILTIALILGSPSFAGAQTSLTLERAVQIYLDRNMDLQAARFRVERTKADRIAASLRPNPSITIAAENLAVGGPAGFNRLYEVSTTYTETIERGGKRELRQRVAGLAVSVAEAQLSDTVRRGVAQVKRLYYDVVLARHDVETAAENRQTFEQLLQLNLARFREGAIPESDLIKVRLERIKFDSAVRQAELVLRQSTIRLLERLGESNFEGRPVAGEFNFGVLNPDVQVLRLSAISERPDIQAAIREVETAAERVALQRALARADLNPFVGYKRLAADSTVLFGVSMPLHIRDRNEGGIARAEAELKTAQAQADLLRNRVAAEVQVAYEAFRTARQQVQTFRNELLRQAGESRTIALAAYEEGGTELHPVLEAQRTLAGVQHEYFRALFDYQVSLIDLELAVGREIQP